MGRTRFIIPLLLLCVQFSFSQKKNTDSLKMALVTMPDSTYVRVSIKIGNRYVQISSDSSIKYYQLSITRSEKMRSARMRMEAYEAMGNYHRLYGKPAESKKYFDQLFRVAEEVKDIYWLSKTNVYLGMLKMAEHDFVGARELYVKAKGLSSSINDEKALPVIYGNMGNTYLYSGDYPNSIDCYLKALGILETMKDTSTQITMNTNIGAMYSYLKNFKASEKHYKRAIELGELKKDEAVMLSAIGNLGLLYTEIKDHERARPYLERSLNISLKLNDKQLIADAYKGLGNLCNGTGQIAESRGYFNKALPLFKELGDSLGLGETYSSFGDLYLKEKKYDEAEINYKRGLQCARSLKMPNLVYNALRQLTSVYKIKGNYKDCVAALEELALIKDSLLNQESIEKTATLKANFEAGQKAKEEAIRQKALDEVKEAEISKQKTLNLVFGIGGIIVLVLALFAFRAYMQKNKANKEIAHQKLEIEEKNKDILASINYSRNIQNAILPSEAFFKKLLPDSFVIYKPKDIVSGDFYFVGSPKTNLGDKLVVFGVADCTGHGVPGAFLTLLGKTFIQLGLTDKKVNSCADALDYLNAGVTEILNKRSEDRKHVRDGMDIALCSINYESMSLGFAGAKNGAVIIRGNEIIELKADKNAIGELNDEGDLNKYNSKETGIKKGDLVYVFSDGFVDQFGGADGKKFKSKQLKEKLMAVSHMDMQEQKAALERIYNDWKGQLEQVDDVCLMGIRI